MDRFQAFWLFVAGLLFAVAMVSAFTLGSCLLIEFLRSRGLRIRLAPLLSTVLGCFAVAALLVVFRGGR